MFRLQGSSFLLTYPRSDFPLQSLFDYLRAFPNCVHVVVSSEHHEDGSLHRHAFVAFSRRQDFRRPRVFDFYDRHPNAQSCRNRRASITYVKKDGDFLEWAENHRPDDRGDRDAELGRILERARTLTREEFFVWCVENHVQRGYYDEALRLVNLPDVDITDETPYGTIEPALNGLILQNSPLPRYQCLLLVGRTGCGKTSAAIRLCPKPALWVKHIDDLKMYRRDHHRCLLFDDLTFLHLPRDAQLQLVDLYHPTTIHVRYGVVRLPAGVPRIFTNNMYPFMEPCPEIYRRLLLLRIE